MGMDVYGKNPKSETGRYFRRNVWGWRPLWDYVSNQHPEIAELVEHGYTNDGDGLGARNAKKLAKLLMDDFTSGKVAQYVAERNSALAELPFEECNLCDSTGIRTDEVGVKMEMPKRALTPEISIIVGRDKGWCNGCNGVGKTENFLTSYSLDEEDVKEFAEFLMDSGGFEIY
jgi:hypothetical protein